MLNLTVKNLKSNIISLKGLLLATTICLLHLFNQSIIARSPNSCVEEAFTVDIQSAEYELINSIPFNDAKLLTSDKLGNSYVVDHKEDVVKMDPKGRVLFNFNIRQLGTISYVGANNPMKILVYYPDYSTIVIFDNTLSQTGRVNLFEMGSNKVGAACIALDNNIWIYDEIIFKLRKIDERMNIYTESEELNVQLGLSIQANFLLEKDNMLYLNDPEIGILVFDIYATYSKTIPLKGLTSFQKIQEQIIYFKDGKLYSYHLFTFTTNEIPLPGEDAIAARIEKDRLFVLRKNQLDIYSF